MQRGYDEMKVHDELAFMPATELLARIGRRDLSPVEVVDAFLERIAEPGISREKDRHDNPKGKDSAQ